jgi:hypothetical protein
MLKFIAILKPFAAAPMRVLVWLFSNDGTRDGFGNRPARIQTIITFIVYIYLAVLLANWAAKSIASFLA